MANKDVIINILLLTPIILFLYPFACKLENSGTINELKEFINTVGNKITGNAIPVILPYSDNAIVYGSPNKTSLFGTINSFKVDKPERIYEVIDIGSVILKIFFL